MNGIDFWRINHNLAKRSRKLEIQNRLLWDRLRNANSRIAELEDRVKQLEKENRRLKIRVVR